MPNLASHQAHHLANRRLVVGHQYIAGSGVHLKLLRLSSALLYGAPHGR